MGIRYSDSYIGNKIRSNDTKQCRRERYKAWQNILFNFKQYNVQNYKKLVSRGFIKYLIFL